MRASIHARKGNISIYLHPPLIMLFKYFISKTFIYKCFLSIKKHLIRAKNGMKKTSISDRVIEYILNCSLEELQNVTVYRLAQVFGVNRCYLARKFKSDKDFTLCEYLVREKLFRAVTILKEDDEITIKEITELIGFSNANYFIRIFKEHFGTSPGRYREFIRKRSSR